MDAMSVLTVVGTVASIGGAWVSIHQAGKSRTAAEEAKKVHAQLVDHRKTSDLAHVQSLCKKAQKSMEKYGPGSVPSSLVGIEPGNDARDVQEFIMTIREHRAYFGNKSPNEADEFCNIVTPLLDDFSQKTDQGLREIGKQIVVHLANMAAIIKRHLDAKKETYR
ncbi:MAG: hypothetical protein ACRBB6_01775 [Neptuniibacter sp.]